MKLRALNLGCGERFHPEWTNLDVTPTHPSVQAHDLCRGIPFLEGMFDIVYQSHLLEHFERKAALSLLRECHRVLRRDGIIRVVVPDLERIAQLYLEVLKDAASAGVASQSQYDWILLELYDQTVREYPGGEMLEFARKAPADQRGFLRQRLGGELDRMLKAGDSDQIPNRQNRTVSRMSLAERLRRKVLRLVAGREGLQNFDVGKFRHSGEVHRWMYDRYSLGRALEQAGFVGPRCVGSTESAIPGWADFHLDTETSGQIYKPDSLYMEATRA
jgi:SAM-dependent methyltransferase